MRGHPENRPAFKRQRSAPRQEVFDEGIGLVAAMRQQAMVGHADTERAGDKVESNGRKNGAGVETEERSHCEKVERDHGDGRDLVPALLMFAAVQEGRLRQRKPRQSRESENIRNVET